MKFNIPNNNDNTSCMAFISFNLKMFCCKLKIEVDAKFNGEKCRQKNRENINTLVCQKLSRYILFNKLSVAVEVGTVFIHSFKQVKAVLPDVPEIM